MSAEPLSRRRLPDSLRPSRAGVVYALVALVLVLTVTSELQGRTPYLEPTNVSNILDQAALLGLLAVSTTIVLISGNFDLSVGSVAALGSALCLSLLDQIGFWPALLVALGTGALVGLVNGVVVQYVGINAFIVTLGTMTAVRGIVLIVTDGRTVTPPEGSGRDALRGIDSGRWITPNLYLLAGIALVLLAAWRFRAVRRATPRVLVPGVLGLVAVAASPVLIYTVQLTQRTAYLLVLAAVAAWVLRFTTVGRRLYATGGNPEAARLSGIAVNRYKVLAFVLNGTVAAFVGVLYSARIGSINPTGLTGYELTALAAAILGGTALFGGVGSVLKSLVGALILVTLRNGFNILNLGANWQGLIEGMVLIVAAAMYTVSTSRSRPPPADPPEPVADPAPPTPESAGSTGSAGKVEPVRSGAGGGD